MYLPGRQPDRRAQAGGSRGEAIDRIHLLEGRYLSPSDDAAGAKVAVVSETMARTHWPNQSAVGARFRIVDPDHHPEWITVVGVVADVRHHGFAEVRL